VETFDEVWSSVAGCIEQFLTSKSTTQLDVLQIISIMIFIVHLHNTLCVKAGHHYPLLHKYALLITFDIVGRLFQICASVNDVFSTSLLPGMLVFIEWFVYSPDMIMEEVESDSYASDVINLDVEERLARARRFFWTSCERFVNNFFAGNIMEECDGILIFCKNNNVSLWEDSMCQGLSPLI